MGNIQSNAVYQIKAYAENLCLDASKGVYGVVQVSTCTGAPSQLWKATLDAPTGGWFLESQATPGSVLMDYWQGMHGDGVPIYNWPKTNPPVTTQMWRIQATFASNAPAFNVIPFYSFNSSSVKCLDILGGGSSHASPTNVDAWSCGNGVNQQFMFNQQTLPSSTASATTTTATTTTTTTTTTSTQCATYTVSEPKPTPQGPINNQGGNVMASGVNVYAIFYGNHAQKTKTIIKNFVSNLGTSSWWSVVRTYEGGNGPVSGNVAWKGYIEDTSYSGGKSLSPSTSVGNIVDAAINAGKFPKDADSGIYVVFTDPSVAETSVGGSLCTDYCGYHSTTPAGFKYALVGDATKCPGTLPPPGAARGTAGCLQRYWRNQTDPSYSINGDQHADSMVNGLALYLAGAATDYANAWRDASGLEAQDKCASLFLDVNGLSPAAGSSCVPYNNAYNVLFADGGKYLLQAVWSASSQDCMIAQA